MKSSAGRVKRGETNTSKSRQHSNISKALNSIEIYVSKQPKGTRNKDVEKVYKINLRNDNRSCLNNVSTSNDNESGIVV